MSSINVDALMEIISKLSVVSDTVSILNIPGNALLEKTSDGLCLIIGECIDALMDLGGIDKQDQ